MNCASFKVVFKYCTFCGAENRAEDLLCHRCQENLNAEDELTQRILAMYRLYRQNADSETLYRAAEAVRHENLVGVV